jgi:phosphatidylinositol alpha-mannosyltransferase
MQWLACYLLILALGFGGHHPAVAAAAVLFAVNVTAVVPVTPSNIGTFQFACVAVLGAYGVHRADALAYGVALQAIEMVTAAAMGIPALLREGVSWRGMRARALYAAPVDLPPLRTAPAPVPVQS